MIQIRLTWHWVDDIHLDGGNRPCMGVAPSHRGVALSHRGVAPSIGSQVTDGGGHDVTACTSLFIIPTR